MTALGGLGHTLPFLMSSFWLATSVAVGVVVAIGLLGDSSRGSVIAIWIRHFVGGIFRSWSAASWFLPPALQSAAPDPGREVGAEQVLRRRVTACDRRVGTGLQRDRFKRGIEPLENWAWGLSLIALTITIHAGGVALMAFVTLGIRIRLERENLLKSCQVFAIVIGLIGSVGLLLAVLHAIEAALWAAAYWWLGALNVTAEALLYSVDLMSTRGASGLMLESHWRMMGALEATGGMLLFGISTAYIFTVMQDYWPLMTRSRLPRSSTLTNSAVRN